jgi:glutaredoxin
MKTYFVIMTILLATGCSLKNSQNKLSALTTLPSFKILSLDSSLCLNTNNIQAGKNMVFLYFSPDCEHCQQQTKEILKHHDNFKNSSIYMITNESIEETKMFSRAFRLDTVPNIFVGKDYNYSFYRAFLPPSTPFLAIYGRKKQLKRIYSGETDIHSIIKIIGE